ncbi:hypothetical protein [Candidatus Nitrosocosmicus sp. R]
MLQISDELKLESTLYNLHGLGKLTQILRERKSSDHSQTKASDRKTIITIADAEVLENLDKKIKGLMIRISFRDNGPGWLQDDIGPLT